jgi:hypothetical protein
VWFCFACYSAGTPERSAYAHWLRALQDDTLDPLSEPLPEGQRPFIAALPQAALANPDGPLAVIGHVDLAWSYSFKHQGVRTLSPYLGVLKTLAEGGRAGVAMHALLQYLNETSVELTILYNNHYMSGPQRPPSPDAWASLWMLHQDLSHFVLLGDPAVRLPLAPAPVPVAAPPPPPPAPPPPPSRWEPDSIEKHVLELLAGQRPLETLAETHGIAPEELRRLADTYRAAGRAALAEELSRKK